MMDVDVKHASTDATVDEAFSEKMEETDDDDIDIIKAYIEKPYYNSNKEPFGLTLNGKSKEYIRAHGAIKNMIKKGKEISTEHGKIKFKDASDKGSMMVAIVQITNDNKKGDAELKVHNPSTSKKKGATIEIRKLSDSEYFFVEKLKNVLTHLLDQMITGDEIKNLVNTTKNQGRVACKPKLFSCDICNWESKFSSALKTHKKRLHGKIEPLKVKQPRKRSKEVTNTSPPASPPRKKLETDTSAEILDLDDMEIKVEKELSMNFLLQKRIRELETVVSALLEEKRNEEELRKQLERDLKELREKKEIKVPKHLQKVNHNHLAKLKGFQMMYKTIGNGACLENALAVHVYEDENEGSKVKRRINNHVADNWDNFYKYKIELPYSEVVGVGKNARTVTKNTREEMLEFLKSEESLMVYSNTQELIAAANLFNIKIFIFTYNGDDGWWSEVWPDPDMAAESEIKFGKWAPDMYLYNSQETHYDLLVAENSRLAHGTLVCQEDGPWKTISRNKKNSLDEKLLVEDNLEKDAEVLNELGDEVALLRGKENGHKRTSPQTYAEVVKPKTTFKCTSCSSELESQGLLDAHMTSHESELSCDQCDDVFTKSSDLKAHTEREHDHASEFECSQCKEKFTNNSDLKTHLEKHSTKCEWNCENCSYQAYTAVELMKHLKITSHQPSKAISNKKLLYSDYRQCYTCKLEFEGYHNLMNHRRDIHPSNKKCYLFSDGKCPRDNKKCWYVHEEQLMEVDESFKSESLHTNLACNLCKHEFDTKDALMRHKKIEHPDKVKPCTDYSEGTCVRGNENCWYGHPGHERNTNEKPQICNNIMNLQKLKNPRFFRRHQKIPLHPITKSWKKSEK